jgi:MoaA/NifB/PqqE/SkfB family radical SAM enzyme
MKTLEIESENGVAAGTSSLHKSLKRHASFFFKYLTVKKTINLILCFFEFKLKIVKCNSFPVYIRFEVCSVCNLRCSGCSLGGVENMSVEKHKNKVISLIEFKKSINDFIPYLLKINLYDEGEPFLNNEITDIVKYLNQNKVATCISSNFSLKFSDTDLNDIIDSGLDHLIISVDGIDQESYSKYRIGGNFSLVISNIRRLTSFIKEKNSTLKVEFQYLEFVDSTIDRIAVKKLAESLDVWKFTVKTNCSRNGWIDAFFKGTSDQRKNLGCYHIWFSGSILSNGTYFACDFGEDIGMEKIGHAMDFSKNNLRNHSNIVNLRKSFTQDGKLSEICTKCPQFARKEKRNANKLGFAWSAPQKPCEIIQSDDKPVLPH